MHNKILVKRGLEFVTTGDLPQAAEVFRQVLAENPNDVESYNYLGAVQYGMHLFEKAESSLRHALKLNPENPDALCNLGALLISTHRLEEAKNCLESVIRMRPGFSEAYSNLGLIQMHEGLLAEAELSFRCAIERKPNSPEIYNNLGLVQTKRLLLAEAELSFHRAIELNPKFPDAYNNLGIVLKGMRRLEEAARYTYRAIKLNPNFAEAYNSLGTVLTDINCYEAAEACFYHAIRIQPDYLEPYHNLGVLFTTINRLSQAEAYFCRALNLNPNYVETEFSLATLYLLQAQYEKGWEKYDKSRMIKYSQAQPEAPRWRGENLTGKRILLYYEQGFGDTLFFVRYAPLVAKIAGKTVLWVQEPLQRLLDSSFPFLAVHGTTDIPPGEFDFCCPLPSLPMVFNTAAKDIPRTIPYIKVCSEIAAKWGKAAEELNRARIGVAWAGNPSHHNDRNRSIPIDLFADLFADDEVIWVSLQVGAKARDLVKVPGKVFSRPEEMQDFAETAGLITHLDLVITVDSAVAHLAGAMGKKTWLLLPFAPDWRWQMDREDSPWYPTMRLFRQRKADDWPDVINRVRGALREEYQMRRD
ncbi:MAG: tetratricopeptide repeat protein [Veillonellales bacterium]